eukprot:14276906-Alexandrium_andersonii.AAC.1
MALSTWDLARSNSSMQVALSVGEMSVGRLTSHSAEKVSARCASMQNRSPDARKGANMPLQGHFFQLCTARV